MEEPNLRFLVCLFKLCLETKNTVGNILIGVLNEPWRWNSIFPMVFHFLKNTILSLTSKWGYVMGSWINYWKLYQPVVINHIEDQTHHLAPKSYFLDLTSTLNHARVFSGKWAAGVAVWNDWKLLSEKSMSYKQKKLWQ